MIFELEPVKRDKLGRRIADYEPRLFYEKITEELLEAHEAVSFGAAVDNVAEAYELIDVMTACATRINALNISDDQLKQIQRDVFDRNCERGYYDN